MVGSLNAEKEVEYGKVFSKYLTDPANLFVISSDFCHWGVTHVHTYMYRLSVIVIAACIVVSLCVHWPQVSGSDTHGIIRTMDQSMLPLRPWIGW